LIQQCFDILIENELNMFSVHGFQGATWNILHGLFFKG
jgi:hypothetical protein